MSATLISDLQIPENMGEMVSARIAKELDFFKSGIATKDYGSVDIRENGHYAKIPFYDQLSGSAEVLSDDTSLTPQKITTDQDIGVVRHLGKAWASRELGAILSGSDPIKEIEKQVATYWQKEIRRNMMLLLQALFDTSGCLNTTHFLDYSATGDMAPAAAVTTMQKVGEEMDDFAAIIVHSKVYSDMLTTQMVTWGEHHEPGSYGPKAFGKYLGMDIIVSDNVPTESGPKYYSFLVKKGAFYIGMQRDVKTEKDRDILAQEDVIASTLHVVPHVKLCKWGGSTNPTDTAFSTVSNWSNVADSNNFIGVCAVLTT